MPNTYAHYRFGDKCINTLPGDLREKIINNRKVYDYGVHGPDIFFYYKVLKHNYVNDFGHDFHEKPYEEVIIRFKKEFFKIADKDAAIAYILGFTAHFVLDSYCHSYVEIKEEKTTEEGNRASHGRIETQFDKYLIMKDGLNPFKYSASSTLHPRKATAEVIDALIPNYDAKTIYKCLKDQKLYVGLLKDSNFIKRWLIETACDLTNSSSFKDLMFTTKSYPEIEDALLRLEKLFNKAVEHYNYLATNVIDYILKDEPLDPYFKNNFSVKKDYKSIPVLSVNVENNYEVDFQN